MHAVLRVYSHNSCKNYDYYEYKSRAARDKCTPLPSY